MTYDIYNVCVILLLFLLCISYFVDVQLLLGVIMILPEYKIKLINVI